MKFLNFDKNDTTRKMLTPKGYFIGAQGLFMEERVFPSKTSMSSEKNMAKNKGTIFLKKGRHLIPSTKLTSSSHKTFHFSYMKFLDEMFIKVKVSSIFKEKTIQDRMSRIRTRSIRSGVHHSNPYTSSVTNTSLI